jgi:hypothetical protein
MTVDDAGHGKRHHGTNGRFYLPLNEQSALIADRRGWLKLQFKDVKQK